MSLRHLLRPLADRRLTIFCLSLLIVLVSVCTVAQVRLGVFDAVEKYMRGFFVWWHPGALPFAVPVFPGGATAGLLLLINLLASLVVQLRPTREHAGLWFIHGGLILFVVSEFATGMFAVETLMQIQEGQSKNYTESRDRIELAIIETTDPQQHAVTAVPAARLAAGRPIEVSGLPFVLKVKGYFQNAAITERTAEGPAAVNLANAGSGAKQSVFPQQAATGDNKANNNPACFLEVVQGEKDLGTWLVATSAERPESLEAAGRKFEISLRHERHYLPFTIALRDFRHDVYPGTNIPKNFSSLVRLRDPAAGEDRDVMISMNNPLRYGGKAFYQSGYREDTISILQVVDNPGWLLPYIAFVIVGIGMLVQFLGRFVAFMPHVQGRRARADGGGAP